MKKIICIMLSITLCLSLSLPAVAAQQTAINSYSVDVSDNVRIDVKTFPSSALPRSVAGTGTDIEFCEYIDDELTQVINGTYGGTELIVTNYKDGEITSEETILVSSRISRKSTNSNQTTANIQPFAINVTRSSLGYMTCRYSEVLGESVRFRVYADYLGNENEVYEIEGYADDTITVLAAAVSVMLGSWFPVTSAVTFIEAVLVGLGITVISNRIIDSFTEEVIVSASYYLMVAYNTSLGTYCDGPEGILRRVTTEGDYYNEQYYEDYTPFNWRDEGLGHYFWYQFYNYSYPGIASYT